MSTLNCPEEVYLAEKLIDMHPWADMVRFARAGGEINSIAIRIARAASGKDNVAFCGYHGWHDWYLASNLADSNGLDGHLLPGLNPNGVPRNLKGSVHPFEYNDFDTLESLVTSKNIGVIKMEVFRNKEPENNFLEKVRKLATDKNIVLVFDECTSGFRKSFGGLHKIYGVQPDMAMFGKALGNGYAVTAVIGRKEMMKAAESTFISSTFWTERIGYVAAVNTLKEMQRIKSWKILIKNGKHIIIGLKNLAKKYNLNLKVEGIESIINFNFLSKHNIYYKTYIAQEMLKKGYLASNIMYVTIYHTEFIVNRYLKKLEPIFKKIESFERNKDVRKKLNGPACETGFGRLTN
jgi:glutamate-1-semialdehyde aminotransferase